MPKPSKDRWSCQVLFLVVVLTLVMGCSRELTQMNSQEMTSSLEAVASVLDRPVERIQLLDYRPLPFAFIEGNYAIYVVRDLSTDETLKVAIDLENGRQVDPSELHHRDQELAAVEGRKLEPQLLDLVLRHPDLLEIEVQLLFELTPVLRPGESAEISWLNSEFRRRFQTELNDELQRLSIDVPLQVLPNSPALTTTLSAPQVIKLGSSSLIQSISLGAEPIILDE